ncbi:MAG: restriction endonuclease subunit S [bacterium]|nr:restriction endonuclease subunit S [bacterium]
MTPQELRNSILQLAIQGQLVEQRPEEGTAEELYQQIQAEKQALIKAGKIKKEKPLPEIGEDEIPFDVPKSWKWVRISNIWNIINGDRGKNYPAKSTLSHIGIPFISALNLHNNTIIDDDKLLCLTESQYEKLGNGKLIKGDIIVCIRGSLGKHGRFPFKKGAIASSLVIIRSSIDMALLDDFLMLYLETPLFYSEIRRYDNGTAQPNLAAKSLEQFLFPLPPLAEQKRIAAKLEELLPLVDRYEKAYSRLQELNRRFPSDLQKSLLQQAIQGKLVEQRPEEGTAEELYQQIQAEKQALIETGKIKKEKPLPEIGEDEIPFDIPKSWKWVRLYSICESIADGDHQPPPQVHHGVPFIVISNISKGYLDFSNTRFVPVEYYEALSNDRIPRKGDILFTVTGSYGIPVKVDCDALFCFQRHMTLLKLLTNRSYIYNILQSTLIKTQCDAAATGTAQKTVGLTSLRSIIIPLPPLAEQKRIVAKLEELLPLGEKLNSSSAQV